MYKNRRFELYLLKNTILSMLPALIVYVAVLVIISAFNISGKFMFEYATGPSAVSKMHDNNIENVELHISRANYLGYDYFKNDKIAGRYYYTFLDGKCVFLIIDSRDDVIYDYVIRGVIKSDKVSYRYLLSQCAADMNIEMDELESITFGYVISEVDYKRVFYLIVQVMIVAVLLIAMNVILVGIYRILFPWRTPSVKDINGVANGKLAVEELNKQLSDNLLINQKHILITDKYLVSPSLFRTDVILTDHIEVWSKHMERKRKFIKNKDIYKLIISDSEDIFYEQEFDDESMVDEIIEFLDKNCGKA